LLWFAGLIAVSTLLPFFVYTLALGWLPASVASILAMSEIAFVAVYAYTLLGERLTSSQILGAALVVCGVLLLLYRRWQNRDRHLPGTRKVAWENKEYSQDDADAHPER
jgi:drug/metabolite transporter (DMT)-like permease